MNREIKFRTWVANHMSYNPYICVDDEHGSYINDDLTYYDVMQYTGLKDKNGTEIYEGDIVNVAMWGEEITVVVKWHEIGFSPWTVPTVHADNLYAASRNPEDIEVIGNICQNPELLHKTTDFTFL